MARLEEEADGGDAGGSGLHAEGRVRFGDAAEGEELGLAGEAGGVLEGGEAEAGSDKLAADALFIDGAEEKEVEAFAGAGLDLRDGVAGDAEDGGWEAGEVEEFPRLVEIAQASGGREVQAVGVDLSGEGGGAVEEDLERAGREEAGG